MGTLLRCTKCKVEKDTSEFTPNKRRRSLCEPWCRSCTNLYQNCKRVGITEEQYWAMHDAQGGLCAICGKEERMILKRTGLPRMLGIDHCHTSGNVRALLCGPCNQAIGMFKDDPELCRSAAEYLELHSSVA